MTGLCHQHSLTQSAPWQLVYKSPAAQDNSFFKTLVEAWRYGTVVECLPGVLRALT